MRGILWAHLLQAHPRAVPEPLAPGPADLVPAAPFADALAAVARAHGPAEMGRLAEDYVALWARTFPTLVRHLRGRPHRTLQLWAGEVYPFLRGERLAARLERGARPGARLALADDLPAGFVAPLVAAFVSLSGAEASCRPVASGLFEVTWRVPAGHRLAAAVQQANLLRVPLLAAALLAAFAGLAAGSAVGPAPPGAWLAVLGGIGSAQAGANAVQDLRGGDRTGPFGDLRPSRSWSWFQAAGGYGTAAACGAWLWLAGRPGVAAFAALGLAAGLLYAGLRDRGAGPFLAGITYGPLAVVGAAYAVAGPAALSWDAAMATVGPASLVMGALAAALVFAGDVADRPLDEAGGRRTLSVRLPQGRQVAAYAALLGAGLAGLAAAGILFGHASFVNWALLGLLPAAVLSRRLHAHLDDPHGLAPVRAGTLALMGATALLLAALHGALP